MTQVTALIRTHNRPEYYDRCIKSVRDQTCVAERITCSANFGADSYAWDSMGFHDYVVAMPKPPSERGAFFYNLYCNDLKEKVKDGWFFFLDDDDFLVDNTAIERIIPYLTDPTKVVICQMLRGKYPKPEDRHMDRHRIVKGHIGMPCIFVHSSLKDSVNFTDSEEADYLYIQEMVSKHGAIFAKEVIVSSERRRYGNPN